jgi:hypothetical protein
MTEKYPRQLPLTHASNGPEEALVTTTLTSETEFVREPIEGGAPTISALA